VARALVAFALIGALAFGWWHVFRRGTVVTDDAYTAGNVVRVTPLVSGTIVETGADATERVSEGEVLLRLDPADAKIELDAAWEELYAQTLHVRSLVSENARLMANLQAAERALDIAKNDYGRRLRLSPGTSVTREELERYRLQSEQARAVMDAARAALDTNRSLLGTGPPEGHPSIRLAAARVERAWLAHARLEIRSPVSGTVARRAAQLGAQASPQQPVAIVVEDGRLWVDANFKESQLSRIRPGMPARVTADMTGRRVVYPGVVEGLGAGTGSVFSLLPPENATGNWIKIVQRVPVRITLDDRALAANPLILGLSCRVEVELEGDPASAPPRRGRREAATAAYDYGEGALAVRGRIAAEVASRLAPDEDGGGLPGPGDPAGASGSLKSQGSPDRKVWSPDGDGSPDGTGGAPDGPPPGMAGGGGPGDGTPVAGAGGGGPGDGTPAAGAGGREPGDGTPAAGAGGREPGDGTPAAGGGRS
jgi:membrane fusion protein (multidrug efflux system)